VGRKFIFLPQEFKNRDFSKTHPRFVVLSSTKIKEEHFRKSSKMADFLLFISQKLAKINLKKIILETI
jgi:hypothetical protein